MSRFLAVTPGTRKRLAVLFVGVALLLVWAYFTMIRMPGTSYDGPLPALTADQAALGQELRRDVVQLAEAIGPRSVFHADGLEQSARWIEAELAAAGLEPRRQVFNVLGVDCANIEVELAGAQSPDEIIVVGAHYDSVGDSPAANDNASGVAGTLALARRFAGRKPARTLRFVFFVNEEPPFFQTEDMGSLVYARRCRERSEDIVAMMCLETIGCYSDADASQVYPTPILGWLYPRRGDFIAFVGNYGSRELVRRALGSFRAHARFPSEGGAIPGFIPGVGWSDHWSFWQAGYPGVMITDTAPFRYPHYHRLSDTPDKLDYDRMARVVRGMERIVGEMAGEAASVP